MAAIEDYKRKKASKEEQDVFVGFSTDCGQYQKVTYERGLEK